MNKIPNRQAICETLMEHAKADKSITVLYSDSRGPHPWPRFLRNSPSSQWR